MIVFSIIAYANGSTQNIYRATDNNKNICGQQGSLAVDYKFSYFYNPSTLNLDNRVCVKVCPSYGDSTTLSTVDCFINGVVTDCNYDITI
jgi:hypothetical protein